MTRLQLLSEPDSSLPPVSDVAGVSVCTVSVVSTSGVGVCVAVRLRRGVRVALFVLRRGAAFVDVLRVALDVLRLAVVPDVVRGLRAGVAFAAVALRAVRVLVRVVRAVVVARFAVPRVPAREVVDLVAVPVVAAAALRRVRVAVLLLAALRVAVFVLRVGLFVLRVAPVREAADVVRAVPRDVARVAAVRPVVAVRVRFVAAPVVAFAAVRRVADVLRADAARPVEALRVAVVRVPAVLPVPRVAVLRVAVARVFAVLVADVFAAAVFVVLAAVVFAVRVVVALPVVFFVREAVPVARRVAGLAEADAVVRVVRVVPVFVEPVLPVAARAVVALAVAVLAFVVLPVAALVEPVFAVVALRVAGLRVDVWVFLVPARIANGCAPTLVSFVK